MSGCPNCGGDSGYAFSFHGVRQDYMGEWDKGQESEQEVETEDTKPYPTWAKCIDCKKRIKLELARKKGES